MSNGKLMGNGKPHRPVAPIRPMRKVELANLIGDHLRNAKEIDSRDLVKLTYLMIHLKGWKQVPSNHIIKKDLGTLRNPINSNVIPPTADRVAATTDIDSLVLEMEARKLADALPDGDERYDDEVNFER